MYMTKICEKQIVLKCPPKELLQAINKMKSDILKNNPHRRGVVSNTEAVMKLIKLNDCIKDVK